MSRDVRSDITFLPSKLGSRKNPGVATQLLLLGGRHKPEDEGDDLAQQSTLKMLEAEAFALQQHVTEQTIEPSHPSGRFGSQCEHTLPALCPQRPSEPKPPVFHRRGPTVHHLPPVLAARNLQREASDALAFLVATARNNAEYVHLLVSYYRGNTPAHGKALSEWLSLKPQNQYFWSGLHHRVRWRSPGRGRQLRLLDHAEEQVPSVRQPGRLLTYVKGWMSEFDDQDSQKYRSRWLSVRSNRGNLSRFFRIAANCVLMAHYLEKVLAQPERGDIITEARKELLRVDAVLKKCSPNLKG